MKRLEVIITSMLDHVDNHQESYKKAEWTNSNIAKVLININKYQLKKIFRSEISKSDLLDEWNNGYSKGCEDTHTDYINQKH